MKTIMYISESTEAIIANRLPESLASIVVSSRKKNKEYGFRSLLCYHLGHYMQVIEGDDTLVDNLLNTLQKDKRHKNINLFTNTTITEAYLDDLPFKLTSVYEQSASFSKYINVHFSESYPLDTDIGVIFKKIQTTHPKGTSASVKNKFEDRIISLRDWPTFNVLTPTRELLELCATLIGKEIPYTVLSKANPFPNLSGLDSALDQLHGLELLDLKKSTEAMSSASMTGLFFNKMRSFIKRVNT